MTNNDMEPDLRDGVPEAASAAFLSAMLPGRYETLREHDDGGWLIRVDGMDRLATALIDDQDVFLDHFCEIELDPGGGEAADIVECILTGREPDGDRSGILLECEYRRRIGRSEGFGTVEGRIAVVPDDLWEETLARMTHEHGVRCLRATDIQTHYASLALRSALGKIDGAVDIGDLRVSAATIMRDVMKLEEKRDAAHVPA